MLQFFKFLIAACLGFFLAMFLIFIFFAGYAGYMASKGPQLTSHSVLEINANRIIPEKTNNIATDFLSFSEHQPIGLREIKRLIAHAAEDSNIDGIVINGQTATIGQASLSSLRESIEEFKSSGKFVYAYADYMSQSGYYLASVADSVFINPLGSIDLKGFGVLLPFFTEMLDKAGIEMKVFYAGDFKSATEPFRRTDMSPENRLQTQEYLDGMIEVFKADIARSRNLTEDAVDDILSGFKGRSAKMALENGLVDAIYYKDELDDLLRAKTEQDDDDEVRYIGIDRYKNVVTLKKEGDRNNEVAVLFAEGTVNYGSDEKGEINESLYLEALERIRTDEDVKALVLRVNSGGGSALTSDIIWHAIERVKQEGKPVVASFGDIAASGGYYIAAGADTIIAQPNTITGSIGVFGMMPIVRELFTEKLGITFDSVKTHPLAVSFSSVYDLNSREETIVKESIDDIYETFLDRVAAGRNMTVAEAHEVAQGRVWTGLKAKDIGLVDLIGDLDDAIALAGSMAGISEPRVKEFPYIKESILEQMIRNLNQSEEFANTFHYQAKDLKVLKHFNEIKAVIEDTSPQARMPYIFKWD